jgi:hypothetical protein
MKNSEKVMKVIDEIGGNIDEETFTKACHYATKDDPHDFLVIEFNPSNKKHIFRKNWQTAIIPNAELAK